MSLTDQKQGGRRLRDNTQGWALTFTCMHTHMHLHTSNMHTHPPGNVPENSPDGEWKQAAFSSCLDFPSTITLVHWIPKSSVAGSVANGACGKARQPEFDHSS